ncbi:MAG: 3-dehydroquinate dehydratase [Oscillospiraceae bacterium]|nr:3-dehydroquinate dehydratase [Oscillospiraceae bacterium]
MLGIRQPEIYGNRSYADLIDFIKTSAAEIDTEVECVQSNHEGVIVDTIQAAHGRFDGIVINPAAYTHTSIAISDALKSVDIPAVEVHLSDINKREDFRRISYAGMACEKTFAGFGFDGYKMAIKYLNERQQDLK